VTSDNVNKSKQTRIQQQHNESVNLLRNLITRQQIILVVKNLKPA